MKKCILSTMVVGTLVIHSQVFAITEAEAAAQIKKARQLVSDMSQSVSRISNASSQAKIALSSGAIGNASIRNTSSPLTTRLGSTIEELPMREAIGTSAKRGIDEPKNRQDAITKARILAHRTIIKEKRIEQRRQESKNSDSGSFLLLILFSALFV